ncbi:hypothetical protein SUGI_0333260 [Cryptomeria japonica]|uniref:uncharacterized protein LOC131035595 n=1 Tax=Cryptomeria japonica TaxID=3369 RepID=UPI0024089FE5|nr:uncharacterized protein LOC131035595 [Cryptomeria japonica]GLJ18680.1 hypothetical protein SUGI_0333260 [Cryptomeria japonica]
MESVSRSSDGSEHLSVSTQGFNPPFEMVQTGDSHIIVAYVPGFRKEDIRVQVNNGETIKISGDKILRELVMTRRSLHIFERSVSRGFSRSFRIPHNVNINAIGAKFHDHVLYVVMPKNSQGVSDDPNPSHTTSSLREIDQQEEEVQPVNECYCSPDPDFPSQKDGDEKIEAQRSMTGMEEEKSSRQGKYCSEGGGEGGGEGLKSGFDYSRIFSKRTTILVSIGVASLAIFAAHKIMSRRK